MIPGKLSYYDRIQNRNIEVASDQKNLNCILAKKNVVTFLNEDSCAYIVNFKSFLTGRETSDDERGQEIWIQKYLDGFIPLIIVLDSTLCYCQRMFSNSSKSCL